MTQKAGAKSPATIIITLTLSLLLLVQQTCAKAKDPASLGGEYELLSKTCKTSLKTMLTSASQIGSCTQLADLVMDLVSDGSESQTSVVEPVSEWETTFCSTAGCTPGAIKQGKKTLSASCAQDIKAGRTIPAIAIAVLDNYPLVRSLACTAAGRKKKGDYCFRKVLADLETASYKTDKNVFSPSYLSAVVAQPLLFLQSLDGTEWCSRCLNYASLKAGPIIEDTSPGASSALYDVLKERCKKKFINNKKKVVANVKVQVKEKGKALPYDEMNKSSIASDRSRFLLFAFLSLIALFFMY